MDFFDRYGLDKNNIGLYDFDKYGVAFYDYPKELVRCPKDFQGEYVIPNGVTRINDGAFLNCSNLTGITIPSSVTHIGFYAFGYCTALTSVTIPNSITSIGGQAFYECSGLTSVHIKDLTSWCRISFNPQPGSNPLVYAHHLYLNSSEIRNLVIPNSVTSIGDSAFRGCSLSSVTIPRSVTSIGNEAFRCCERLSSIEIPSSVVYIGLATFQDCPNLIEINVATGNLNYSSENGVLFNKDKTILLQYPIGKQGDYTIPNSVTSIGDLAFSNCTDLTMVTIPNCVTNIGIFAFYRCDNLKRIIVPHGHKARFVQMGSLGDFAEIIHETSDPQKELLRQQEREAREQEQLQAQQLLEMLQDSILFFDTETTGVPKLYNAPVTNSNNWPRLVQLAWLMADKNGNVLKKKSVIIKPDGYTIPQDATAVHGISTERAQREGQPLDAVLEEFMDDVHLAANVVGHNIDFDMHIVGAELYRLDKDYGLLMDNPCTCTMKSSTDFCAIPNPNSYFGGYKWPSLQELYRKLFNRDFADAHDALADITATKECYFELRKRGIL